MTNSAQVVLIEVVKILWNNLWIRFNYLVSRDDYLVSRDNIHEIEIISHLEVADIRFRTSVGIYSISHLAIRMILQAFHSYPWIIIYYGARAVPHHPTSFTVAPFTNMN